jgi:hypothetical protein
MLSKEFITEADSRRRSQLCEAYSREAINLYEEFACIAVQNKFTQQQIKQVFEAAAAPVPAATSYKAPTAYKDVNVKSQGQAIPAPRYDSAMQQQIAKAAAVVKSAEAKLSASMQQAQGAIENFDEQFEQLKSGWAEKYPKLNAAVQKLRELGEKHHTLQHGIIILLQSLAGAGGMALGGPIGAGIAVGILTTGINLLMGQSASKSIAKGAVSGVAGAVLGAGAHEIEHALHIAGGVSAAAIKGIETFAHVSLEKGAEAAAASGVGQVAGSVAKAAVKGATGITLE